MEWSGAEQLPVGCTCAAILEPQQAKAATPDNTSIMGSGEKPRGLAAQGHASGSQRAAHQM